MKSLLDQEQKGNTYLKDDGSQGTNNCVTKRKLEFEDYKNSLEAVQIRNQIKHLEKIKFTQRVLKKITKNS